LYKSIPRRIVPVLKAKGGPTPYIYTRAIRKVNSDYFRQIMWEGEELTCAEVASQDSLLVNHHITGYLMFLLVSAE
jgi:hypothetical protein